MSIHTTNHIPAHAQVVRGVVFQNVNSDIHGWAFGLHIFIRKPYLYIYIIAHTAAPFFDPFFFRYLFSPPKVNSLTRCMVCHLYVPTFLAPGNMPPARSMVFMVFRRFCSGFSGTCTIFFRCHLFVSPYTIQINWELKAPVDLGCFVESKQLVKSGGHLWTITRLWYCGERAKELGVIYFPTKWGAF